MLRETAETVDQDATYQSYRAAQVKLQLGRDEAKRQHTKQQKTLQENVRRLVLDEKMPPDNSTKTELGGGLDFLIQILEDIFRKFFAFVRR